jgi:hypothetical protein
MNTEFQTWKVSWNYKKYDAQRLINDYKNGAHTGFIKCSKGLAKMNVLPKINDIVFVSWKKQKIMKCKVVSEFVVNEQEIQDQYHIGHTNTHAHTQNNTFLQVQIVEIYDTPELYKGNQRTWVKII